MKLRLRWKQFGKWWEKLTREENHLINLLNSQLLQHQVTVVTNVKLSDTKTPSQNKAMLESLWFLSKNIQPNYQNTFWYVSAKPKIWWNFMFGNVQFYISLWSQHCVCALLGVGATKTWLGLEKTSFGLKCLFLSTHSCMEMAIVPVKTIIFCCNKMAAKCPKGS